MLAAFVRPCRNIEIGGAGGHDGEGCNAEGERLIEAFVKEDMIRYISGHSSLFTEASLLEYVAANEESIGGTRSCTAAEFLVQNPVFESKWMEARKAVSESSIGAKVNARYEAVCKDVSQSFSKHLSVFTAMF